MSYELIHGKNTISIPTYVFTPMHMRDHTKNNELPMENINNNELHMESIKNNELHMDNKNSTE